MSGVGQVAAMLPQQKLRFNHQVVHIEAANKTLHFKNGDRIRYNKVWELPSPPCMSGVVVWLHAVTAMFGQCAAGEHPAAGHDPPLGRQGDPRQQTDILLQVPPSFPASYALLRCVIFVDVYDPLYSHIIGIGIRGVNPHDTKCWLYYPEDDCPFYRCTVFSHYAEKNVPSADVRLRTLQLGNGEAAADSEAKAGPYWSLMFEVSESAEHKHVDMDTLVRVSEKIICIVLLAWLD